jgi:hypothetical protein
MLLDNEILFRTSSRLGKLRSSLERSSDPIGKSSVRVHTELGICVDSG